MSSSSKTNGFSISKNIAYLTFFVTLIAAVVARTYQLKTNFDFASGRYINDSIFANYTLIIVVVGMAITALIFIFGKDKSANSGFALSSDELRVNFGASGGFFFSLVAGVFVFDLITQFSAFKGNFSEVDVFTLLELSLSLVLCIVLIAIMLGVISKGIVTKTHAVLLSVYPIVLLLEVFDFIKNYQIISTNSQLVYIILGKMLSAYFVLCFIRFFCGFEKKSTKYLLVISGCLAAVLTSAAVFPWIFVKSDFDTSAITSDVSDIGIILLVYATLTVFRGKETLSQKTKTENGAL